MIRKDFNDKIFRTGEEKQKAIIDLIIQCNKKAGPFGFHFSVINQKYIPVF